MAIQAEHSLLHWNYFLALEADLERLARYVEFSSNNFEAYSIEMAHLLLAAASEVDVIAKQLCSVAEANSNPGNIEKYRTVLRSSLPEIEDSLVTIPRYGLTLQPWINWREDRTPDWWRDHNKVKHERGEHFQLANLNNVLNAMAGLFLFVLHYQRIVLNIRRIEPPPNLFTPAADLAAVCPSVGGRMALFFKEHAVTGKTQN